MSAVNGDDGDLPSRPSGAGLLWRRLLNLDPDRTSQASTSDLASVAPPLAPLDKNATSMRVLLHDTQANFEKFSTYVESLLAGVSETKTEIKTVSARFDRDRETMLGDIVDLVNRSQRELQKCMGTPAQAPSLDAFSKELFRRISVIDQRLDSLQSLSHAHTQSLQAQVQATQLLLDKQGTIIAAVTPLLPLLQTLPLLIESVKTSLKDNLQTVCRTPSNESSPSTLGKRPRTASTSPLNRLTSTGTSTRKRTRQDSPPSTEATDVLPGPSIKSPLIKPLDKPITEAISTSCVIESMRRSATYRSPPEATPNQAHSSAVDDSRLPPVTPRRPLSELAVPRVPSRQPSVFPPGHISPRTARPLSSRTHISPSLSRAPSKPHILPTQLEGASDSIQRSASRASSHHPSIGHGTDNGEALSTWSRRGVSGLHPALPVPSPHQKAATSTPGSSSAGHTTRRLFTSSSSVHNPASLRTLKDKRSPLKGRRFIPLLDSDDEGEGS